MIRRTRTFTETIEYDEFEVGDKIRPATRRCPLEDGVYTVTEFRGPIFAADYPLVFVEGHREGMNAYYFKLASEVKPNE